MDNTENKSLITQLIQLAKADNKISQAEFQFLISIAGQMGFTGEDLDQILAQKIEFIAPVDEFDRIVQFHRMVLLMNVDLDAHTNELHYVKNMGVRLGLHPSATNEVLHTMNDYPNRLIPAEKLISIFKTYHN